MRNFSIQKIIPLLAGLFISVSVFAQYTEAEQKEIDKSVGYYNDGKYDKAIETISKVQLAHILDDKLWSYRVAYENDRYNTEFNKELTKAYSQAAAGKAIKVSTEKSDADKTEMLNACFEATMFAEKQELASHILGNYYVFPQVDTAIGDAAKDNYSDGNKEYSNEAWMDAIKDYKKAVAHDSNYYNATFSIGMAYYKNNDYDEAIPWFQHAIRIEKGVTSAYISLVDCYMGLKQWENAKNTCIDGILIYPEYAFFDKLETIADKLGKTFDRHWQYRVCVPNSISGNTTPLTTTPWQYYVAARDKISDNCDDKGIVTKQPSFTDSKYLESFSWEFMLKKSSPDDEKDYPEMDFARKMQTAGFLDCYAFVSCYQINFSQQYKDFAKNNADRIRTYINTELIK